MKLDLRTLVILTAATGLTVACGKKKKDSSSSADTPVAEPAPQDPGPQDEEKKEEKPDPNALYKPANLPASFAMTLPGSLAIDTSGGASLCLDDACDGEGDGDGDGGEMVAPSAPDDKSSHGLFELRYQLDNLQWRIKDYTQQFAVVDTVITAHKAECDKGCTIKDAKGKITLEMVNLMIENSGGAEAFSAEELKELKALVGLEFPIGDVTVEHPAADPNDFNTIITIVNDEGENKHRVILSFQKKGDAYLKVRVKENSSGVAETEPEPMPEPVTPEPTALTAEPAAKVATYSTDLQLDYDAVAQVFSITDSSEDFGYKYKNTFKFAADPKKAAVHGTTFSVVIDNSGEEGQGSSQTTTGFADDNGAYLETIYSYDEIDATITLSAAVEADKSYSLYLGDMTAAELTADPWAFWSVGYVDSTSSHYHGPIPTPDVADFRVFEESWTAEGEDYKQTFTASTLTVASIVTEVHKYTSGYSEQVDAKGKLLAYCYYETVTDGKLGTPTKCSSGYDDDYAYGETYASYEDEDGEFEIKGSVAATVSGATMTTLKGRDFYIVRKQANIDAFLPSLLASYEGADNGAADQVIGVGYYVGDKQIDTSADPNDVYEINFWSDATDATTAHIVLIDFDDDYKTKLTVLSGSVAATTVK